MALACRHANTGVHAIRARETWRSILPSALQHSAAIINMKTIYPVDHSNEELQQRAAELSQRILAYDSKTGNGEHLIKDSVLFNVTYIELQNRAANRATRQMVFLTCASAVVAAASLMVAWLSYAATSSGDKWQREQLELLKAIAENGKPTITTAPSAVPSAATPRSPRTAPLK